jgi:general L-amino acid transport system substrate-binding protein
MVTKKSKITSAKQLKGATVACSSGTPPTTEKNSPSIRKRTLAMKTVLFVIAGGEQTMEVFYGRFLSFFSIFFLLSFFSLPGYHDRSIGHWPPCANKKRAIPRTIILPDLISRSRSDGGAARRRRYFAIAKWVVFALIEARNMHHAGERRPDESRAPIPSSSGFSARPKTRQAARLDKDWAYRAITSVGNYGEIFERNVGPKSAYEACARHQQLWNKGGIMYAPPHSLAPEG